jgi:hypothetical protein
MTNGASEFRDPTGRANWARWLLYAQAALAAVGVISGVMEYSVLSGIKNATFASDAEMIAAAEASDTRQMIIGFSQLAVIIAGLIAFFMWVYRSNRNARSFGPHTMRFTPGWSVGWFFIPIANLWKPYQAVKEIWEVSRNPASPEDSEPQPLLGWWWFFWIVALVVSNISFRLTLRAESIDELILANFITNISDAIDIPSCLLTVAVITRIYKAQMARTAQQAPVIT